MGWLGKKTSPPTSPPQATVRPHALAEGASSSPPPSGGTAVGQAVRGSEILAEAKGARETAQTAVNLLEELVQPSAGEVSGLDEVKKLLQDMTALLVSIDGRLAAVESRLSAPRVVSLR